MSADLIASCSRSRTWADIMQMCYFVTYSRNRIRFESLTTRLGDCEPFTALKIVYVHLQLHDTLHER